MVAAKLPQCLVRAGVRPFLGKDFNRHSVSGLTLCQASFNAFDFVVSGLRYRPASRPVNDCVYYFCQTFSESAARSIGHRVRVFGEGLNMRCQSVVVRLYLLHFVAVDRRMSVEVFERAEFKKRARNLTRPLWRNGMILRLCRPWFRGLLFL